MKELVNKFITDINFKSFCGLVDELKKNGEGIQIPMDTALLLFYAGVDFLKGDLALDFVHSAVMEFLQPNKVTEEVSFYEYFVTKPIVWTME